MGFMNFGMQMLNQLGMNTSNRIGTGRSLRNLMAREQVTATRREAEAGIIGRVEGAKAAGIHPLVAMGSNVGGATLPVGPSFNGNTGDYVQAQVQDREMKLRKEELEWNKAQQGKADQARKQQDALNKLETASRIRLLEAQAASEQKRMADSDRDFLAAQQAQARAEAARSNPLRVQTRAVQREEDRVRPQYVPLRDRFGKIQYVPNPEVYDLELPSLVGAGTLALPEVQPASSKISKWWNDLRNKVKYEEDLKRYYRNPPKPIAE